jgi:hypothetical protein
MRLPALAAVLLVGCASAVSTAPAFDEDVVAARQAALAPPAAPAAQARPEAPAGRGLRTGTIARARLTEILDAGPPGLLRQIELAPRLDGERFIGWQLVQLVDRGSPLRDADLAAGDVLLAINGQPLSRPDQLMTVWDSLRVANTLVAQLWRGDAAFELRFAIEPAVAPATAQPTLRR